MSAYDQAPYLKEKCREKGMPFPPSSTTLTQIDVNRLLLFEHNLSQSTLRKAYFPIKHISTGVPQGSVMAPMLYNLYTSDIPHHNATQLAMYADDTVIFSQKINILSAYRAVQQYLQLIGKVICQKTEKTFMDMDSFAFDSSFLSSMEEELDKICTNRIYQ
ncbi:hypothetical protein ANN_06562 [Periplaneta americana]|uniref:Reverse transcriptase domain-containing protein n=1 Tax=Periplaneta americana TaxID=6978 RepID=A0ABQ8TGE2_PERAM|nr:hypothetical protein ANN_06562 [Periplaneta americana]